MRNSDDFVDTLLKVSCCIFFMYSNSSLFLLSLTQFFSLSVSPELRWNEWSSEHDETIPAGGLQYAGVQGKMTFIQFFHVNLLSILQLDYRATVNGRGRSSRFVLVLRHCFAQKTLPQFGLPGCSSLLHFGRFIQWRQVYYTVYNYGAS